MQILTFNILAITLARLLRSKEVWFLGIGGLVIAVGAVVLLFVFRDSGSKEKETPDDNQDKKPPKEEKQRIKEEKRQQKLAQKEAKKQQKQSKPAKEKKLKPAKKAKPPKTPRPKKEKAPAKRTPPASKKKKTEKQKKSKTKTAHKIAPDDYEYITKLVRNIKGKHKSVLFASCSTEYMPITIPVKVAMQLSMDKKCLLIDLDLKRNAVAKAFDIDSKIDTKQLIPMPYKTFSENLFVWPSHNFVRSGHMNIIQLVEAAIAKFDYVIISCPCLDKSPDRRPIAAAAGHNIIFTKNDTHTERLTGIISSSDSNVMANIQIMDTEEHHDILDHTEDDDHLNLEDPLGIETDHADDNLAKLDELPDIEPELETEELPDIEPEVDIEKPLPDYDDLDDLDVDDELTVEPEGETEPDIDLNELDMGEDELTIETEGETESDIDLDDLDDLVAGTEEDADVDIMDIFDDDEPQEDKS
jgi:Mrp family chromosome partitioning ATPase